jgi:hypothetical protein
VHAAPVPTLRELSSMRIRRAAATLLVPVIALVAIACSPRVKVRRLSPEGTEYASVPPDSVRVFRSGQVPPREYESIALLTASGGATGLLAPNAEDVVRALQKKAGELGANAIIMQYLHEKTVCLIKICTQEEREATGRALAVRVRPP